MRASRFILALLSCVLVGCVRAADEKSPSELVTHFITADTEEAREDAARKLRVLGAAALPALREAKPDKDDAYRRVRDLLTAIAADAAKVEAADATSLHDLAREEALAHRYANAEKLYRRAHQIYSKLKEDADERKDKVKTQRYKDARDVCEKMKDKAARKAKGDKGGYNLGFIRVGQQDNSDDWE
ncbi:MAG TPA: hypothetical protein VGP72_09880 [Planctomycetota bacterium]|jgi:hypothetical protein